MTRLKQIKKITLKGRQAIISEYIDSAMNTGKLYIQWRTADGCPLQDWSGDSDAMEALLGKVREWIAKPEHDDKYVLWSY